jgi:hypothetical protein
MALRTMATDIAIQAARRPVEAFPLMEVLKISNSVQQEKRSTLKSQVAIVRKAVAKTSATRSLPCFK